MKTTAGYLSREGLTLPYLALAEQRRYWSLTPKQLRAMHFHIRVVPSSKATGPKTFQNIFGATPFIWFDQRRYVYAGYVVGPQTRLYRKLYCQGEYGDHLT